MNVMMNDGKTTYLLPLNAFEVDEMAETASTDKCIPLWNCEGAGSRQYLEYKVYAQRLFNNSTNGNSEVKYSTYKCVPCKIDVPTIFRKQHENSAKHKLCLKIIETALERTKDLLIPIDNDSPSNVQMKNVYFCEPCACIVKVQNKVEHELSKEHFKSLLHDKFLNDLFRIFDNKDYLDSVSFDYFNEGNERDVKVAANESVSDGFITASDASVLSDCKVASNVEEKPMPLKDYIDVLNKRANKNQFALDGDCVKVTTLDKAVVKIPIKHFHGFYELGGYTVCGSCQDIVIDVDRDTEVHIMSSEHIDNMIVPLKDMHCIREGVVEKQCLLCNTIVVDAEVHKLTKCHVSALNQALCNPAPITVPTKPVPSDKYSEKTYCEPCSREMRTCDFEDHCNGKYHKENVDLEMKQFSILYLTKVSNKVTYCIPCNRDVYTVNIDSHCKGKSHYSFVELYKKKQQLNGTNIKSNATVPAAPSLNKATTIPKQNVQPKKKKNQTYCEPCACYIDSHNYNGHTKGRIHENNLEYLAIKNKSKTANVSQPLNEVNSIDGKTFCTTCKLYINTCNLPTHLNCTNHKTNLQLATFGSGSVAKTKTINESTNKKSTISNYYGCWVKA